MGEGNHTRKQNLRTKTNGIGVYSLKAYVDVQIKAKQTKNQNFE